MSHSTAAIVVAAGTGERFGLPDKAFVLLGGRPMAEYSLDALQFSDRVQSIVLVAGPHTLERAAVLQLSGRWSKLVAITTGGATRQDSVREGLAAIGGDAEFVAIHDAARPLIRVVDIDRCVDSAIQNGAAILAVPVTDTLKMVEGETIDRTIPREGLWAAQTPQAFRTGLLRSALDNTACSSGNFTDEASVLENLGIPVRVVPGSPDNIKITILRDLLIAEALLEARGREVAGP